MALPGGGSRAPQPVGPMTPMPKVPPPWVPGSPLAPSTMPGAEAPGSAQWQVWWNFNQDPYLRLRSRIAGLSASSGEGEAGSRPSRAQIEGIVMPALVEAMRVGGEPALIRPLFLSLARIQNDMDTVELGDTIDWVIEVENQSGGLQFQALRKQGEGHPMEEVGARLRELMPWLAENRLVDRSKN